MGADKSVLTRESGSNRKMYRIILWSSFFLQRRTVNINQLRGILPDLLISCNKEDGGCRRTGSQMITTAKKKEIISVMEGDYNINQVFILEKMQSRFATSSPFQIR